MLTRYQASTLEGVEVRRAWSIEGFASATLMSLKKIGWHILKCSIILSDTLQLDGSPTLSYNTMSYMPSIADIVAVETRSTRPGAAGEARFRLRCSCSCRFKNSSRQAHHMWAMTVETWLLLPGVVSIEPKTRPPPTSVDYASIYHTHTFPCTCPRSHHSTPSSRPSPPPPADTYAVGPLTLPKTSLRLICMHHLRFSDSPSPSPVSC